MLSDNKDWHHVLIPMTLVLWGLAVWNYCNDRTVNNKIKKINKQLEQFDIFKTEHTHRYYDGKPFRNAL